MNFFNTYQSVLAKLNYALFLLLLIALPLPRMILQPIAVAWIICWLLEGRFFSKARWKWSSRALPGLLLTLLTVWEAVSLLWAPDAQAGLRIIERHWPFIILVLIPIFGLNEHYRPEKLLSVLFAACVASVPIYLFTYYWVWNYDAVIWFRPDLIRPFEFPTFHGITSVMKLRSYYCLTLTLSIFSAPILYRHYRTRYPRRDVIITLGVGIAVMLAGMVMTGSRSALLVFAVTAILMLFVSYRKRIAWWAQLLIIAGILSLAIATIMFSPRFSLFANTDLHDLGLSSATEMTEPRLYIWHAVCEHIGDYGFFGLGAGQHVPFLMEQYRAAGNEYFLSQQFGTHSQYFSCLMCLGPLALLLLIAAFVSIPMVFKGKAQFSSIVLAVAFMVSMLADDFLERMDSILILLVWMILLQALAQVPDKVNEKM